MPNQQQQKLYFCPGERHPITRSVHLSRLAAFYPKCRDCALRSDTGQIALETVKRLQSTERRVVRNSLSTAEGFRGVYLNELDSLKAGKIAAALASMVWEHFPLTGRKGDGKMPHPRPRPSVVVGYDERPSSPDIVRGVAAALRKMGCAVIDVGLVSKPCFWFAIDHLEAAAGIYATGAGHDPSWTGLDLVGVGGLPLSRGTHLDALEARLGEIPNRPSRQSVPQRTFRAVVPYEAGLWKHFHALRPLTVCCASASRPVSQTLKSVFSALACRLQFVAIPQRLRDINDSDDSDVLRLGAAVRERGAYFGILIDDDGQRCAFCDEEGRLVSAADVSACLSELFLAEHPQGTVAVESSAREGLRPLIESAGGTCIDGCGTLAGMSQSMRSKQAGYGGGDSGRQWFAESFPVCDAVLTLAKVLSALSRSDASFSETMDIARPVVTV